MKISTLLIACAINSFAITNAKTQPIIQSFVGGNTGNTIIYKDCDSTSVMPGPSGENVNWDFSGLSVNSTRFEQVVNPEFAPNTDKFPEANYCRYIFPIPESFTFYESTATALFYHGFSLDVFYLKYTDPIKSLQFPFTYNNSYLDTGLVIGNISQETSYRSNIADAYGTLILPNASYDNVLRIKTTDISIDSNYSTGNLTYSYLTEYNYYNPNMAGSLLIISERKNDAGTIFKVVMYSHDPIISTTENELNSFKIYPNPASDHITIENPDSQSSVSSIRIYDISGREVLILKPEDEKSMKLNLSGFENGVYIIRMISQEKVFSKKLIVKH